MVDELATSPIPPDEGDPVAVPAPEPEGDEQDGVEPVSPESDDDAGADDGDEVNPEAEV